MAETVFIRNGQRVQYPPITNPALEVTLPTDYNVSFSNDSDGHRTLNLSWTDPRSGETMRERHDISSMERETGAYLEMARANFERSVRQRVDQEESVRSMRGHPDESRHMQEIRSLLGYFDNARRFSGMPMEVEQLVRVITALHRELSSHHCAISWLINREPPRHDERFQQLELRLDSLEQTIDLFTNEP